MELSFSIGLHIRDKALLGSLIQTLNCGRYISKPAFPSASNTGEFVVEKFSDIEGKIIPIFEKFKLHGVKSLEFEDFKLAALLIGNKDHLTRKGLDELKLIKGRMNKKRKQV